MFMSTYFRHLHLGTYTSTPITRTSYLAAQKAQKIFNTSTTFHNLPLLIVEFSLRPSVVPG